jgi:hypothetical protein
MLEEGALPADQVSWSTAWLLKSARLEPADLVPIETTVEEPVSTPPVLISSTNVEPNLPRPTNSVDTVVATSAVSSEIVVKPEAIYPDLHQRWTNSLGVAFSPVAGTDVLFSVWETRRTDYGKFCQESGEGRVPAATVFDQESGPEHPVVNVSWKDATNFCAWLTGREQELGQIQSNQFYRLPTDLEWSAAVGLPVEDQPSPSARSGKLPGVYPWGTTRVPTQNAGNYPGQEIPAEWAWYIIENFEDGQVYTAPVGNYRTNSIGLHDLGGNVWEWCLDAYDDYSENRVLRGAAWDTTEPRERLASYRYALAPGFAKENVGFRCVLVVGENDSTSSSGDAN